MDARTAARIAAVQAIYEQEVNTHPFDHDVKAKALQKANEFSRINKKMFGSIFGKAAEEIGQIDGLIQQNLSETWTFERIGGVMRSILRAAIAEHLLDESAKKVIISEYVSIADGFYDEKEVKFVNAILDKIVSK